MQIDREAYRGALLARQKGSDPQLWLLNCRVFDPGLGRFSEPQNILVQADKIACVTHESPSDTVQSVSCGGRYLLPGIALPDICSHVLLDLSAPLPRLGIGKLVSSL